MLGLIAGAVAGGGSDGDASRRAGFTETDQAPRPPEPPFVRVPGIISTEQAGRFEETGLEGFESEVPRIEEVAIRSSADGEAQPALWLPPAGGGPRPLLVVLHSWSTGYQNSAGIPFAQWAQQRGWAMIQPHYRGPFDRPQATGSDVSVQDVLDAVDFAARRPDVDGERVFAIGFSGGGMMSLLLAGRHPDRFAGIASWVPIYDLADWHEHSLEVNPEKHYAGEIEASCGGDPSVDTVAAADCARRSPRSHLDGAKEAEVPLYIGVGLADDVVPPDHALRAFNHLAGEEDQIPQATIAAADRNELPPGTLGTVRAPTFFDAVDPEVVFARRSGPVTVILFDGRHDMVYHPALRWFTTLS